LPTTSRSAVPTWPVLLKERIVVADKYFSVGKVKGSETLRGKVIILFGPPSAIDKSDARGSKGKGATDQDVRYSDSNATAPNPLSNVGAGAAGLVHSEKAERFSFEYDQQRTPPAIGKPFRVDIAVRSAANQEANDPEGTGREVRDRRSRRSFGEAASAARGPSRMNDAETRLSTLIH